VSNIAALAAARNIDRHLDLRIRRALGASLWELAKGHLLEVGILVAAATAFAWLLARPLLVSTLALLPPALTLAKLPTLDSRVFGAAILLSLVSAAIVAIWPIATIARLGCPCSARTGLIASQGSTSTRTSRRSGALLVSLQAALAFVLLVAGALTVASFAAASRNVLGYQRDRMILIEASVRRYVSPADAQLQLDAAAAFINRAPGVERTAVSTMQSTFLRRIDPGSSVIPEGWKTPPDGLNVRQVSREFFEVMGLELVEGRLPLPGEWQTGGAVAIVSRSAARGLWPNRSAIGRTLVAARKKGEEGGPAWSVIGVVADARFEGLDRDPAKEVYLPGAISLGRTGLLFHIRTRADAESLLPGVVRDLTAQGLRVDLAATHDAGLFESVKNLALPAWLFGALAVAALVVVVIWGLAAMGAVQRTREFGVRIALGATSGTVVGMLIREQLVAVVDGIFAGALISAWLVTLLRTQLYGVGPHNPIAWSAAALTMLVVALVAAAIPALRATAANPVDVLRAE
jgi:putative ABC transport system permease protein